VRDPNFSDEEIRSRLSRQITDPERLKHATWSYDTAAGSFEDNKILIDQKIKELKEQLKIPK